MERYERNSVKTYTSLAVLNTGQAIIFTVGLTATMLMCALGVRNGTNTVGDFVMVNAMMIQLYQPLNFMGMVYREIKQAIIDIEKMFNVLQRNPEIKDIPGAAPLVVSSGNVRFDDVRFAYDPERPILKGLSFEVPAGKTVAIVGPSGAGKSTISRLLFRLYDVSSGKILIDGQDIRNVTQASLRASIGMVPQDTVLFNDTIRYNIRYGRWDAGDAEVEEAAQLAQIDSFIRMSPKGYETQVGERGLKLSGGEKQRVAIARTVLKAPPILVLDEATSALDSHTEHEIQEALERVSRGRTSLVIAHRLSTIVGADEIIVLDQGRIAERGTHIGLLASGGLYASMWNRQREAEEAREKLAQIDDGNEAPNRAPPPVDDPLNEPPKDRAQRSLVQRSLGNRRGIIQIRRYFPKREVGQITASLMSIANSIRAQIPPIHPEGYPFIGVFAAVSLILFWIWTPLGWIGTALTVWCALFFRDPVRVTPVRDGIVVSPADGRVSMIAQVLPPAELGLGDRPLPRISIFMSVFNCHVNRSPVAGRIDRIAYRPGAFINAELDKASEDNERNSLVISTTNGRIGVVQIAGLVARRIVSFVREGQSIGAGERFGLIRFGSRLDVYLPEGTRSLVSEGQTAVAGETILADFGSSEQGRTFRAD